MIIRQTFIRFAFFSAASLPLALPIHAATVGMITKEAEYAWGDAFGWVAFAPESPSGYHGLTVTDSGITGYAWSSTHGWIHFSPKKGGVTNTPEGVLDGHAWSSRLGWISFTGVRITEKGVFTGIAGSSALPTGRLSFDCARCRVTTTWRPARARAAYTSDFDSTSTSGESPAKSMLPSRPRALPLSGMYEALKGQNIIAVLPRGANGDVSQSVNPAARAAPQEKKSTGEESQLLGAAASAHLRAGHLSLWIGVLVLAVLLAALGAHRLHMRRHITNITH